ncbi:hypothetical protein OSB04_001403 [Centaurea solstitialis]|uniref:Uncharacterized protein n=1 Tax=Centaurea solstitialis TaxID=347529 RepID=A0AA38U948_9ASTR|nr:hypothetical protein OSB04_001403 [Centaurea solstitialis]
MNESLALISHSVQRMNANRGFNRPRGSGYPGGSRMGQGRGSIRRSRREVVQAEVGAGLWISKREIGSSLHEKNPNLRSTRSLREVDPLRSQNALCHVAMFKLWVYYIGVPLIELGRGRRELVGCSWILNTPRT